MSRPARLPAAFTLFDRLLSLGDKLARLFPWSQSRHQAIGRT